jgi:tryptophan 2,3-dioxygenase
MSNENPNPENLPDPPAAGHMTYGEYLKVGELLSLQQAKSDPEEHDELLFIVIHQVYELWFKLVLHELDKLKADLEAGNYFLCLGTLKRIRTVLKTLVSQLDVLETMTPLQFSSFRDRLDVASGFQSAQFREFEFALGYKRPQMMKFYERDSDEHARLQKRLDEPSILHSVYKFLEGRGVELPDEVTSRPANAATEPSPALQEILLSAYSEQPDLVVLMEALTDIDEGIQEWRYRHVKMVERTIGTKMGTGGSSGSEYLKHTLFKPLFPDLWAIRSRF